MKFIDKHGNIYHGVMIGNARACADGIEGSAMQYVDSVTEHRYKHYLARPDQNIILDKSSPRPAKFELNPKIINGRLMWGSVDCNGAMEIFQAGDWLFFNADGSVTGIKELDREIEYKAIFHESTTNCLSDNVQWRITLKVKSSDSESYLEHLIYDPLYESMIKRFFGHRLSVAYDHRTQQNTLITDDGLVIEPDQYLVAYDGIFEIQDINTFNNNFGHINQNICWK